MLEPTNANRALVNRGIALRDESVRICESMPNGDLMVMLRGTREMIFRDYTRDLNACYEVCEERGLKLIARNDVPRATIWSPGTVLNKGVIQKEGDTDLRWLVALAVWEAVKADA